MVTPRTINSLCDIPLLVRENVKIKNTDAVIDKLKTLMESGKDHLQIITDYDLTLTTQHYQGVKTPSSFSLFCQCKSIPAEFVEKDKKLVEKYYPIERNVNMPLKEKIPHMVEWYKESEQLFKGVKLDLNELREHISTAGPPLREGTIPLCQSLKAHGIPVLVLSAGLGDVLRTVLEHHGLVEHDTFHIISNFFKLDGPVISGFGCQENGEFLHSCNKNGLGCSDYFNKLGSDRYNIIIMGDSLGDAAMDQGVPELKTVLKIGFLYGTSDAIEDSLPKFMNKFDIVLVDDQTMAVPQAILDLVVQC